MHRTYRRNINKGDVYLTFFGKSLKFQCLIIVTVKAINIHFPYVLNLSNPRKRRKKKDGEEKMAIIPTVQYVLC